MMQMTFELYPLCSQLVHLSQTPSQLGALWHPPNMSNRDGVPNAQEAIVDQTLINGQSDLGEPHPKTSLPPYASKPLTLILLTHEVYQKFGYLSSQREGPNTETCRGTPVAPCRPRPGMFARRLITFWPDLEQNRARGKFQVRAHRQVCVNQLVYSAESPAVESPSAAIVSA